MTMRTKSSFLSKAQTILCFSILLIHRAVTFTSLSVISRKCSTSWPLQQNRYTVSFRPGTNTRREAIPGAPIVILVANEDDEPPEEDDDEDDEEEPPEDPYTQVASSEFIDTADKGRRKEENSLVRAIDQSSLSSSPKTSLDWGGALGKLRQRFDDVNSGKSQDPSHVLFRLMSSQSPNQLIGSFITTADPQVVQAMSGAVSSLLGGLSSPTSGVEMVVKASGDKIGSLCFQLQMTGYMFRNAEYVMALKQLMKIRGSATLNDYKAAFKKLDRDNSGYIDASEVAELLDTVYDSETPGFEIKAFLNFFDADKDGKVSWKEFERGLGLAFAQQNQQKNRLGNLLGAGQEQDDNDDDEDDDDDEPEPQITGVIEVELEDGNVVEVDAKEYISSLKEEAKALKMALRREALGIDDNKITKSRNGQLPGIPVNNEPQYDEFGGIASYIASRRGDLKALTEGISPEIVETMKMLVQFVLEDSSKAPTTKNGVKRMDEVEMELPGSALQQLALWQLVLGYRLREAEAKEEYLKLLE